MSADVVLDTNIVLDVFVFDDVAARPLRAALGAGTVRWLATAAMRQELERVLAYPKIAPRLVSRRVAPGEITDAFDSHAVLVPAPGKAAVTCRDADDQKFIDLAVAHGCLLLSKDAQVLVMRKRIAQLGAHAAGTWCA